MNQPDTMAALLSDAQIRVKRIPAPGRRIGAKMSNMETTATRVAGAHARAFCAPSATTVADHPEKPAGTDPLTAGNAIIIAFLPPTYTPNGQTDHTEASWRGKIFRASSATGAVPALARVLLAAGVPDQPWQARRAGRVVLYGPSLATVAMLAYGETPSGPRARRWQPMSSDPVRAGQTRAVASGAPPTTESGPRAHGF